MDNVAGFFIGGQEVFSDKKLIVSNPYTGSGIAACCVPSQEHASRALQEAARAFNVTKQAPACKRADILHRAAALMESRREALSHTISLESGKPVKYAKAEVGRALQTITLSAEEAGRIPGEVLNMDAAVNGAGRMGIVRRFPVGPVLGITPFNFPLNLVCHKAGPALAAGNTITVKPSRSTPLTCLALARIFNEAGLEPGAFNVLPADISVTGMMVQDKRVRLITFTGSPAVGWNLKKDAYDKQVLLELGGNAGVIVEPGADLDFAAGRITMGGFAFSGQVCISVQRVFAHRAIFDDLMHMLVHRAESLVLGDPLSQETDIGPMITDDAASRAESWIKEAEDRGAGIVCGGHRDGRMVSPCILTNVPRDARAACKEIFGPVIVVEPYDDFADAVRLVNDSEYGLQAGVFTNDVNKALDAFDALDVGGVIVNDVPTYRIDSMPYGGVKESGNAREGVTYAIQEMTEQKLLVIRRAAGIGE